MIGLNDWKPIHSQKYCVLIFASIFAYNAQVIITPSNMEIKIITTDECEHWEKISNLILIFPLSGAN